MIGVLSSKRSITSILQSEANECGLACLAMLANYHRHDIGLSFLRALFPLSYRGMTMADIVQLAGRLDLDVQGLAVSNLSELQQVKCPALLHWQGNHFVVLEKVERGRFHVHDPAFGLRVYDAEDVERLFSGIALEFEPRVQFAQIKQQKKSVFWTVFKACRGIEGTIAVIAVMSFAGSLFSLATPIFLQIALDTVIPQYDLDLLTVVTIGMALFIAFEAGARWIRDSVTLRSATIFELFFTRNIVGHAFRLPLKFFELRHPGDFITRMTSIDHVKTYLVNGFVSSVADGIMSILLVIMMFYYSPTMASASVATLVVVVVLRLLTYPKLAEYTTASLDARSEEQTRLIDGLKNVAAIKANNSGDFFGIRWFDSFTRFANTSFRTKKLTIDTDFLLHIVFMIGTIATLYMGVTDVMKSVASIGILYAFFSLRGSFFQSMNVMILNLMQLPIMRVHLERLNDILDEEPETKLTEAKMFERHIRKDVALKDVTLQFDRASTPLLDNVNLTINVAKEETIAIIGESGSGKSSLLKVLASLHQPHSGAVAVDGQPLDSFGVLEYRANVGSVFAEDALFAGIVTDNLSLFSPEISRDSMEDALRTVGLLDEIHRLPQGFATLLSDESPILSTGQRRRLLLARAICRKPKLLLLDEITANLDPKTEQNIVEALEKVRCAKVFVTHSEKLLRHVDRVYGIRDHRLVEVPNIKSGTANLVGLTHSE